ncbi:glycosyltransferase [Alteromonas halophila]|uniref:Uncharacterized protein n=1 Tax=Alteromonas halophila TaxID=516698 RepID=A0A918JEC5_9ALTE|nr:glycosyltransferase [Alteromonas halophila]GGW73549.1 hypothetical protein GCM10007391_01540 [Alteromonas halophila]
MHALLLTGQNQYGVVSHFLAGIIADLKQMAIDTALLNAESPDTLKAGLETLPSLSSFDFVISFNGVGLGKWPDGTDVCALAPSIPIYVFCVDHPIHVLRRIWGMKVRLLCIDQEHVQFASLCGFKAEYFAHAISSAKTNRYSQTATEYKHDTVLFPASYIDKNYYHKQLASCWDNLGYAIEQCTSVSRFMEVICVLPAAGKPARLGLDKHVLKLCILVDKYLRAKQREARLHYFDAEDVTLTVVGRQSEKYQSVAPRHHYSAGLPFDDLLTAMSTARFVVHHSPGFERGLHERVVYPLAMGTPVVAVDCPYVNQTMGSGVVTPAQFFAGIDDKDYDRRRTQARQQVFRHHTWLCRLEKMLSTLPSDLPGDETTQKTV